MNMFKKTNAKTIDEYLSSIPDERKHMMIFLDHFIRKAVPKLTSYFATNMIGYGKFPYKNYKNETVEWPVIALANQKQYVSIYVCSVVDGVYVAEKFKHDLGDVKVGRSCISIRTLEDLRLPTLEKVLQTAAKFPGLVMGNRSK